MMCVPLQASQSCLTGVRVVFILFSARFQTLHHPHGFDQEWFQFRQFKWCETSHLDESVLIICFDSQRRDESKRGLT